MALSRLDRTQIAWRRLTLVLGAQGVSVARTLEQKISDAGPASMRIDPHILTPVRNTMVAEGVIVRLFRGGAPWFHLANTPPATVDARLRVLEPIYRRLHRGNLGERIGQALEIAIFRALSEQSALPHIGGFADLDAHDDKTLYRKIDPSPVINGRSLGEERLDFLVYHPEAGTVGIEAKNIREWLYPDRAEIIETLAKCVTTNCVPVIIARRIHFSTFVVLSRCGVLMHQTYNQLMPASEAALALQARDKDLLGFHDIRLGNQPDGRLQRFISQNLPATLAEAREKFNAFKDLLEAYALLGMPYKEFAARVRRRSQGAGSEDSDDLDWGDVVDPEDTDDPPDF
jgi:hypothetical protein